MGAFATQLARFLGPRLGAWIRGLRGGRPQTRRLLDGTTQSGTAYRVSEQSLGVQGVVRAVLAAAGLGVVAEFFIPDGLVPDVGDIFGGDDQNMHPAAVVKSWSANGIPFVRLADGRMGAYSANRGSWKYWRPKKPIVIYAGGSSSLKTLLRADRATERQLRRVKKVIDRRFPRRRERRVARVERVPAQIVETGPGHVIAPTSSKE